MLQYRLKDGKEMKLSNRVESVEEPDGTVALVIKNARPEDAGSYSFVAQNPKGEVKSSAPVIVNREYYLHAHEITNKWYIDFSVSLNF